VIPISGLDDTSWTVRSVTAATTLTNNDYILLCNPAGGAFTVTVPAASSVQPGRNYIVRSTGTTNAVTVSPASGTINGAASVTLPSGATPASTELYSDGTNWFSLGASV